ncbi:Exo_endo_phos domain-containing protein [Cephalotus follicularis]|uniref:Exo_endo_phos domain-containing protein n=1 Tax=Cephalotus follicularis TaxID=3775 RepID=A0A1Q3DJP1_CEPFO|nr:Exo_endo_phos domain-containing protein [Cephalotus follicularis]
MWDAAHIVFDPFCINEQAIHGKVTLPNQQEIMVSFVYGLCDNRDRKHLWNDIISHASCNKKSPWTVLGDFNVTRFSHEHSNNCRVTKAMEEFNGALRSAELEDINSTGLKFTWSNMRRGTDAIFKKLDRALGNWQWFKLFGDSYAHIYNPGISDHSPISIQLMQQLQSTGRPFKFLNFWAEHPHFLDTVRTEWEKTYDGSPLQIIKLKLKGLKSQLKKLNTRPDLETASLRQMLKNVQLGLDDKPDDVDLRNQEFRLRSELATAARNEEAFFKQKSRILWLREGDSNTAYFHKVVTVRQSKNHIACIQNEQGAWLESQ